jgi:hypothetical protein
LQARDNTDPLSFKVRRGKVGGYKDHFDALQAVEIESIVNASLDPQFGYSESCRASENSTICGE